MLMSGPGRAPSPPLPHTYALADPWPWLAGVPVGLACVGAARLATASLGWAAPLAGAGVLSFAAAATVAGLLLPLPLGVLPTSEIPFDAGHVGDMLTAFVGGAALLTFVGYVWPAAVQAKAHRAQLGVCLGFGVAAAAWVLQAGLCLGTPYCLAAAPQPQLQSLHNGLR